MEIWFLEAKHGSVGGRLLSDTIYHVTSKHREEQKCFNYGSKAIGVFSTFVVIYWVKVCLMELADFSCYESLCMHVNLGGIENPWEEVLFFILYFLCCC